MLKRKEDLHIGIGGQHGELLLETVTSDQDTTPEIGVLAQLLTNLLGLHRQLTRGRHDDSTSSDLGRMRLELLQHGDQEGGSLS